jgi:hypothetical protein
MCSSPMPSLWACVVCEVCVLCDCTTPLLGVGVLRLAPLKGLMQGCSLMLPLLQLLGTD